MPPVSQAPKRYFVELGAALLLYGTALYSRKFLLAATSDAFLRSLILLSPIVPILLAAVAIYRFYHRMDEYARLRLLESLAFSAGGTGVFVVSWGFLQGVGFPGLPLYAAWLVMGVLWGLSAAYFAWRDAASEHKTGKLIRSVLVTVLIVVAGTALYGGIASLAGWYVPAGILVLVGTGVFLVTIAIRTFSQKSTSC